MDQKYELLKRQILESKPTECLKSAARADQHRNEGNVHFQRGYFYEALTLYNKSICFAPSGSSQLGLAYANRSAVYVEAKLFSKAIENIKLALENGYPEDKKANLDAREKRCLKMIDTHGPDDFFDPWNFFKLTYPANEMIPFIVSCLELREDNQFGRFVITNKDLKTGDFIAIEEPPLKFINDAFTYTRCSFCLTLNRLSLFPCPKCSSVMYCSEDCSSKDKLHHLECPNPKDCETAMAVVQKSCLDSIRIAGGKANFKELVVEEDNRTVFDFDFSNPKDPSYEKNMLIAVNSLSKAAIPENISVDNTKDKYENDMVRNQLRIHQTNSFKMDENRRELFGNGTGQYITRTVGSGIFPFTSLINHSCYPNVKHITVDNKFVIVVTRPIKAGEQLFISYGYSFFRFTRKERYERLSRYKFKCECIACIEDYPKLEQLTKENPRFKEVEDATYSALSAIAQFKKNCAYIEKHIKEPPSYELMRLMCHNDHLLHGVARIDFDNIGIEL